MSIVMEKTPAAVYVPAFGIEADHPRNCDLLLQSIPGCRLRSAIRATRTARDAKTGREVLPVDQARGLGQYPPLPGMQLHVNPAKLSYVVTDPLNDNPELLERLREALNASSGFRTSNRLRGVEKMSGTLDEHRMKTLVREMFRLVESGEARVVVGPSPKMADIDDLPGKYLLNPGSIVPNTQPVYENDWPSWLSELTRHGG